MKTWISLDFGQIRQLTTELAILECLKFDLSTFQLVAIDPFLLK